MAGQRFVSAIVIALGVVGCSGGTGSPSTPPGEGVLLQVVPDLSEEPPDVAFAAVPDLLVIDDGRAFYAAPDEFAFQGTLVPDVWVAELSPGGVEMVREAIAAETPPLTIDELSALVGAELADVERYSPESFRFAAVEIGLVDDFDDPDTPLLEWPDSASIPLADAATCSRLPELEVGEVFVTAAENSAIVDDGIVYGIVAAQDWPGAPCVLPPGFATEPEDG